LDGLCAFYKPYVGPPGQGFGEYAAIILASLGAVAAASAGAVYIRTRRLLQAVMVATVVVPLHFVLLLAITLSRWEG
jgi:hypothetical protein